MSSVDDQLSHLAECDEDARRRWWSDNQPADPRKRFYWWETFIEAFLDRMRAAPPMSEARRRYGLLAVQATREAVAHQVLPAWKAYVRLAFLAAEYGDASAIMDADELAGDALALIGEPSEEMVAAWDPARARRTKNVVRALGMMAPHVRSPELRAGIARWLDVWDRP